MSETVNNMEVGINFLPTNTVASSLAGLWVSSPRKSTVMSWSPSSSTGMITLPSTTSNSTGSLSSTVTLTLPLIGLRSLSINVATAFSSPPEITMITSL